MVICSQLENSVIMTAISVHCFLYMKLRTLLNPTRIQDNYPGCFLHLRVIVDKVKLESIL